MLAPTGLNASGSSLALEATEVELSDDSTARPPTARVFGQPEIGVCDPMVLDGSGSSGNGLVYTWSSDDEVLGKIMETQYESKVIVPESKLTKVNFDYQVSLVVKDFMGKKSLPATFTVTRSSMSLPKIALVGTPAVITAPNEQVLLQAKADFAACEEAEQLEFVWTQVSTDTHQVNFVANGRLLIIEAGSLYSGGLYHFKVEGFPGTTPALRGSATATVSVLLPDLVAHIGGGDRDVSVFKGIVLNSIGSHDPSSVAAALLKSWTCVEVETGTPCRRTDNTVLSIDEGTDIVTLPPGTLMAGLYRFVLHVRTEKRLSSTSVVISVKESEIPEVSISIRKPDYFSTFGKVNAGDRIILDVDAKHSTPNSSFTYRWSISDASINGKLLDVAVAPTSISGPTFVLSAGVLEPGQDYTFRVGAVETYNNVTSAEGAATLTLRTNSPPSIGVCNMDPASGIGVTTEFSIVCNDWMDDTDTDLYYSFSFENAGIVTNLQTKGRSNSKSHFTLPAGRNEGGSIRFIAEIMDSMGGTAEWSNNIVVSNKFDGLSEAEQAAEASEMLNAGMNNKLLTGDSAGILNDLSGLAAMLAGLGRRLLVSESSLNLEPVSDGYVPRIEHMIQMALNKTILSVSTGTVQGVSSALFGLSLHVQKFDPALMLRVVSLLEDVDNHLHGEELSDQMAAQLLTIISNLQHTTHSEPESRLAMGKLADTYKLTIAKGVLDSRAAMEAPVWIKSFANAVGNMRMSCQKVHQYNGSPWTLSAVNDEATFTVPGDSISDSLPSNEATAAASEMITFVATYDLSGEQLQQPDKTLVSAVHGFTIANQNGALLKLSGPVTADIRSSIIDSSGDCYHWNQALGRASPENVHSIQSTLVDQGTETNVQCVMEQNVDLLVLDSPIGKCASYATCSARQLCTNSTKGCTVPDGLSTDTPALTTTKQPPTTTLHFGHATTPSAVPSGLHTKQRKMNTIAAVGSLVLLLAMFIVLLRYACCLSKRPRSSKVTKASSKSQRIYITEGEPMNDKKVDRSLPHSAEQRNELSPPPSLPSPLKKTKIHVEQPSKSKRIVEPIQTRIKEIKHTDNVEPVNQKPNKRIDVDNKRGHKVTGSWANEIRNVENKMNHKVTQTCMQENAALSMVEEIHLAENRVQRSEKSAALGPPKARSQNWMPSEENVVDSEAPDI